MERAYRIRTYTIIDSATGSLVATRGLSLWRERARRLAGFAGRMGAGSVVSRADRSSRAPSRGHRAKGLNETLWLWRDAPDGM
jgi:hypothetical protein